MELFSKLFKRKSNYENIIKEVYNKTRLKRFMYLFIGCFIVALAFNAFFFQYELVCFGISGLSIVASKFGIDPSLFILISNIVLLFISYIFLGPKGTKNSIVGSILFPILVKLTSYLVPFIKIDNAELLLIAICGAVLSGIGYGLVFKSNFTTGGTDIIDQIFAKYTKMSIGNSMIIVDGLVVLSGILVFPLEKLLYGFLVLYIISVLTDKVILGISQSKTFYIITEKEAEVRDFLLNITNGGLTLINSKGGDDNDKHTMFLVVIPTKKYFVVKEGLKAIDNNAFFLVCDAYEVNKKEVEYD